MLVTYLFFTEWYRTNSLHIALLINCYGLATVLVYVYFYVFKPSCVFLYKIRMWLKHFVVSSNLLVSAHIISSTKQTTIPFNICVFLSSKDALVSFWNNYTYLYKLFLYLQIPCSICICKVINCFHELPDFISYWFPGWHNKYCSFYYFSLKQLCFCINAADYPSMRSYAW